MDLHHCTKSKKCENREEKGGKSTCEREYLPQMKGQTCFGRSFVSHPCLLHFPFQNHGLWMRKSGNPTSYVLTQKLNRQRCFGKQSKAK